MSDDSVAINTTNATIDDNEENLEEWFKTLSKKVVNEQKKIRDEIRSSVLNKEYKRSFTFSKREAINNSNKSEFVRYIAENEEEIRRRKKEMKEKEKLEKEEIRRRKKEMKEKEKEEEWFKTLSKKVANEQKKIRDEIRSSVLNKEYKRSFTFSKREAINNSNKSEFVRYIAENEEEIRRRKKEMKEKEKLEKEEIRRRNKFFRNFTKTGNFFIRTLYGTAKRLSAGASLIVAGLITRGSNLYDPYAKAQKYGLLVNTDKKYDNALISRARFTPEISRESVSSELANYYKKQWHYQTRKQELNPHLHRLNLNSNASVEKVLSTIKQQYTTEPQRRQIARDVGLEDAYIASLQKKVTLEENSVEVMREAKLAVKDVIGKVDDVSTLVLPLFIKTLKFTSKTLGEFVDYRVNQENLSYNNRQSANVNSNLPTYQEVSKMKDNATININFNGSVYNPDEITNKIQEVVQTTIDNNKINDTLYQAI